jgi:imidazolonepropionase-like amidohydrolase
MGQSRTARLPLLLVGFLVLTPLLAMAQPPAPQVHALVGGRVVTEPGRVLDPGTVVLRDGRIEAVGAGIAPPADARTWDARGLTIYAGLLESYLAPPPPPDPPARQGWEAPPRPAALDELGPTCPIDVVRPEHEATRLWTLDADRAKQLRSFGFAAACMVPGGPGLFRGQAAWIALNDRPPRDAVLLSPAGACIALAQIRDREIYPSSKMGNIAVVRQTFLDLEHRGRMRSFLAKNPARGSLEPAPWLDALEPVATGKVPILWEGDHVVGDLQAVQLTRELHARAVICGAGREYQYVDSIAAAHVPMILPVNFPDPPDLVAGEEYQTDLETLRHWERAPENPAILLRAGVPVALTTYRLRKLEDFPREMREAREHGLTEEQMLAALTTAPAAMLGVADRLGRIAPGMLACLTVTDGPLFEKKTRVREVWSAGERFWIAGADTAKAKPAAPDTTKTAAAPPPPRPAGRPWDAPGPIAAPPVVFVRGATVWTCGPAGKLEHADLLVRGGKIAGVGQDLAAPADALIVDGAGFHVTPGIIDCHSHATIDGYGNESSKSSTAEVRIGDVLQSRSIRIYQGLAGGVTTSHLFHGSANAIGGQDQVMKYRWGATAEGLRFRGAPAGIKFALGENVKQSGWGERFNTRYPQTRMGVEQVYRDRFQAARDYRRAWDAHRKGTARPAVAPPRRDLELDALAEILEGKRFIHCHAYRQDEMLMLTRVAQEMGFSVRTFQHALESYKIADELAEAKIGCSLLSDWWAYKFEVYDAIPYAGAILWDRGVLASYHSDSAELHRRLNLEAAKAVKYGGVPPEEALKFVTLNSAIQLGIDRWVGSLEPGKDADFVLWSGSPLSAASLPLQTWIEGKKYFDREVDQAGRLAAEQEREWLIAQARADRERLAKDGVKFEEPGEDEIIGWDAAEGDEALVGEGTEDAGLCEDHEVGFQP